MEDRAVKPRKIGRPRQTHCKHGHPIGVWPNGRRECRTCNRNRLYARRRLAKELLQAEADRVS